MLSRSPPVCFNSDAAAEGRGETILGLLILLLANDPHQATNVDRRELFVSPSKGTSGVLSSIRMSLQEDE